MNPLFGSILIHCSLLINHLAATFFYRATAIHYSGLIYSSFSIYILQFFCIVHTALLPTPLLASNFSYYINKLSSTVWLSTPNILLSSGSMAADSRLMFSSLPLWLGTPSPGGLAKFILAYSSGSPATAQHRYFFLKV